LSALLLFGFLRYTTGRLWASAIVAALFALHPLRVESVAWAAQRKDVLSVFFLMLTICTWAVYARRPGKWRYILVVVLYGLGLMSKPTLVTLPVVLLLLDYWPLRRFELQAGWLRRVRTLAIEKIPLLVMSIGSSSVTIVVQEVAIVPMEYMDVATRITNIIVSYGRYLWQMAWPVNLALLYPRPHEPEYGAAAVAMLFLLGVSIAAAAMARRRKYFVVGWLWYLITLLPVIGIIHVGMQSHADRYTYVPLIGAFVIIVWWAADACIRKPRLTPFMASLAVVVLVVLGIWTSKTIRHWKSDVTIFERTVAVTRDNVIMMLNLGDALLWRGYLDQAQAVLEKANELSPMSAAYNALAIVLRRQGRIEEAINSYKKAIELEPGHVLAHLNAGILLHDLKRHEEAEVYLRRAIELDPKPPETYAALALVLGATDRVDEGIVNARKAVEINPGHAEARRVLASLLAQRGEYQAAAEQYRLSLEIESNYAAWVNLGVALIETGELEEARQCLQRAILLEPAQAAPHLHMAKALDKLGRRTEAIQAVTRALELDPNCSEAAEYSRRLLGDTP
ncbi:MAG TPA: tetratricopeptide repeat protein, partial [Sedimentisphaerales bacterium]|nr:tetratricopeptide repeat protein [Sedimentisphaerales bacterium]